jgi:hypothetical protein
MSDRDTHTGPELVSRASADPHMEAFKHYLKEINIARVWHYAQNFNVGILSASRHEFQDLTEAHAESNRSRSRALQNDIRDHRLGFTPIKSHTIENQGTQREQHVHDRSYLVTTYGNERKLQRFLEKHGAKYEQESVLYKPHYSTDAHLITTSGEKKGSIMSVGRWHPSNIGEYYSAMKNGKTFTFESIRFVNAPGWFSRWDLDFNLGPISGFYPIEGVCPQCGLHHTEG